MYVFSFSGRYAETAQSLILGDFVAENRCADVVHRCDWTILEMIDGEH
jgi:hypothetical protein